MVLEIVVRKHPESRSFNFNIKNYLWRHYIDIMTSSNGPILTLLKSWVEVEVLKVWVKNLPRVVFSWFLPSCSWCVSRYLSAFLRSFSTGTWTLLLAMIVGCSTVLVRIWSFGVWASHFLPSDFSRGFWIWSVVWRFYNCSALFINVFWV